MRLLVISPDFPVPPANATRQKIYQLLRFLGERHEVSLLAFHEPGAPPTQEDLVCVRNTGCRDVVALPWRLDPILMDILASSIEIAPHAYRRFRVRAFQDELRRLLRHRSFDLIHCDINMTEMIELLEGRGPVILSPSDSFTKTYLRSARWARGVFRKAYNLFQAAKFFYVERTYYPRYSKCHVVSQPEADFLNRINPRIDTAIVPIGADVPEQFMPEVERRPQRDLVFSGQMSNPSTRDSIIWFVSRVWANVRRHAPGCRLWLVGRTPDQRLRALASNDPSIILTGFVENMNAALRDKLLYICPLLHGAGIKTRLLEAMANSLPVVTTSIGAEGIDIVHGKHACVADGVEAFTAGILSLLSSREYRERVAEGGYRLVRDKYTWRDYAQGMERVYEEAIRKHSVASGKAEKLSVPLS